MITKKMASVLNQHLNREYYSAYLYLSMSSHANYIGLKGMAHWFQVQIQEEQLHAQKFRNYILDQGEKVILAAIAKPPSTFKSPLSLFEETLKHEKEVTAAVNQLAAIAKKENDFATSAMLQWFITEQVEEETNVTDIVQKLKLIGGDGSGLFMLDKELGTRVFAPPPDMAK